MQKFKIQLHKNPHLFIIGANIFILGGEVIVKPNSHIVYLVLRSLLIGVLIGVMFFLLKAHTDTHTRTTVHVVGHRNVFFKQTLLVSAHFIKMVK